MCKNRKQCFYVALGRTAQAYSGTSFADDQLSTEAVLWSERLIRVSTNCAVRWQAAAGTGVALWRRAHSKRGELVRCAAAVCHTPRGPQLLAVCTMSQSSLSTAAEARAVWRAGPFSEHEDTSRSSSVHSASLSRSAHRAALRGISSAAPTVSRALGLLHWERANARAYRARPSGN